MKTFRDQFIECWTNGLTRETIQKPITPDNLPCCPIKLRTFLDQGITHLTLIKCGKFGGVCESKHEECKKLRSCNSAS